MGKFEEEMYNIMKYITKAIFFVAIFSVTLSYAQTYEFNKKAIYSIEYNGKKEESVVYINTNNDNYYLKTKRTSDRLFGIIIDYEKNKIHNYELINLENRKYDMKYIDSKNFYNWINYKHYGYELSENDAQKVWNIYNNKKMKNLYKKFEFQTEESEDNLFSAFRFSCLHPFEFNKNLSLQNNVIVKNSKITYNHNLFDCNLKSVEKINISLKIP